MSKIVKRESQQHEKLPIDSDFYKYLEQLVTKKSYVNIKFFNDYREYYSKNAIIKNFLKKEEKEYIKLNTGDEVRLDLLVSVNDKYLPGNGFDEMNCTC